MQRETYQEEISKIPIWCWKLHNDVYLHIEKETRIISRYRHGVNKLHNRGHLYVESDIPLAKSHINNRSDVIDGENPGS